MQPYIKTFLRNIWLFAIPLVAIPVIVAQLIFLKPNYMVSSTISVEQPIFIPISNSAVPGLNWLSAAQNLALQQEELLKSSQYTDFLANAVAEKQTWMNDRDKQAQAEHIYKTLKFSPLGNNILLIQYNYGDAYTTSLVVEAATKDIMARIFNSTSNQSQIILANFRKKRDESLVAWQSAKAKTKEYATNNLSVIRVPGDQEKAISQQSVEYDALVQLEANAANNYRRLNAQYEQLEMTFDAVSKGRADFVRVVDQPRQTLAFVPDQNTRWLIGGISGLLAALMLVALATMILTWCDRSLREYIPFREKSGVPIVALPRLSKVLKHKATSRRLGSNVSRYRRRNWVITGLVALPMLALSGAVAWLVARDNVLVLVIMVAVLTALVICRWPVVGFFLGLSAVMFCEVFSTPDIFSGYTSMVLTNFNSFSPIKLSLTPLEVMILFTGGVAFIHSLFLGRRFFVMGMTGYSVALFGGFLAFGYVYGVFVQGGGDAQAAQWEIRALVYIVVLYFLSAYFMQDIRLWKVLSWIIPIAAIPMCLLTILRATLFSANFSAGHLGESLNGFNHDTALIFIFLLFWCVTKFVLNGNWQERFFGGLLIPAAVICLFISQRRAAFAVLAACGVVLLAVLLLRRPKIFATMVVILAFVIPLYMGIFGNDTGPAGMAARAFNSATAERGSRDYNSDLFRKIEKSNVQQTIAAQPLTGVGFGQKFTRYQEALDLEGFVWQDYTPHIQVLWLWLKVGMFGWMIFWFIICNALFKLGQIVKRGKLGQQMNVCVIAGMIIVGIMVFSYVDLGLYNTRMMFLMGVSIGLLEIAYRSLAPLQSKQSKSLPATAANSELEKELVVV